MKLIKDIVISVTEPSKNVGWLRPMPNGTFMLYVFGTKGWESLSGNQTQTEKEINFQFIQEIPDIIINIQYGKNKKDFRKGVRE